MVKSFQVHPSSSRFYRFVLFSTCNVDSISIRRLKLELSAFVSTAA